jgi:hypothetical protein
MLESFIGNLREKLLILKRIWEGKKFFLILLELILFSSNWKLVDLPHSRTAFKLQPSPIDQFLKG